MFLCPPEDKNIIDRFLLFACTRRELKRYMFMRGMLLKFYFPGFFFDHSAE